MTAIEASGDTSTIPEHYSALSISRDHVICETVKEEENGTGTILRLYECKNIRDKVDIYVGLSANAAYLCDMMENELSELPIKDGKVSLCIKGFEIVTIKLK